MFVQKKLFLHIGKLISSRGSNFALSAAGHVEVCVYTTAHFWPPAGLRGACSRRPKSRELALFQRITVRRAEPSRAMKTPQFQTFVLLSLLYQICITPCFKLSSSLLCDNHATTAVARTSSSPLCDGHGRRFCVCVCHASCIPIYRK